MKRRFLLYLWVSTGLAFWTAGAGAQTPTFTATLTQTATPVCNLCPTPIWTVGPGTSLGEVRFPLGVAVDNAGNVFVADNNNDRIEVFNGATGSGIATVTASVMDSPWGLALDGNGHLFAADEGYNQVLEFNVSNPASPAYMNIVFGNTTLIQPFALALDDHGDLLVTDYSSAQKFRWNGTTWNQVVSATMGGGVTGSGSNQFSGPCGIAAIGNDVYVSDGGNDRIQRWVRAGNSGANLDSYSPDSSLPNATIYQEVAGTDPRQFCFDSSGRYVHAVTNSNLHQVFDTTTTPWTLVSSCENSMDVPFGIAVDSLNNSYISCYGNYTFLKFAPVPCLPTPTPTFTATVAPTPTVCASSGLSWGTAAPMPAAVDRFAGDVVNGILYCVGGQNMSSENLTTVEGYNPSTNTWSAMAPLPTGMMDLAVAAVGATLYAVGGYDGTNVYNTLQAYNPSTNTWSAMATLPTARCNLGVGVVNGILYAVGGANSSGTPLNTVEAYNPATNSWSTMAGMPTARSQLAVGVVNGILYAAGGGNGTGFLLSGPNLVNNLEAFNPATNSWTTGLPPEPNAVECALGEGMNGSLYVVGGCATTSITNTVESYDPVANAWTVQNPMPGLQVAQAGGVINGVIYSVGGWSGSSYITTNQAGTLLCSTPTPTPRGANPPSLGQCFVYPSPVRGTSANVSYYMDRPGSVVIKFWNEKAELVDRVTDSKPSAGVQTTPFTTSGFATGVYFYTVVLNYNSGSSVKIGPQKFVVIH